MHDKPQVARDVLLHLDGSLFVYTVALFGNLTEEWLLEWDKSFPYYDIHNLDDHCARIALMIEHLGSIRFYDGYGRMSWEKRNWQRISICDSKGNEEAYALVKLTDASRYTIHNDIVEVVEADWNGI